MMQSGIVMLYIMPNNSISTGLILLAPTVFQSKIAVSYVFLAILETYDDDKQKCDVYT